VKGFGRLANYSLFLRMLFHAQQLAYHQTGSFSKIILDYLEGAEALQPYYTAPPTWEGIESAIKAKGQQPIDRSALVQVLQEQYRTVESGVAVAHNIEALLASDTFTVCTAHQPNLFSGPLFFIYKILHAIRLADVLNRQFPQSRFVPVYYMGSEDADKEELNHTYVEGKRFDWLTTQTGAVGRMLVDASVSQLLGGIAGQLGVLPFGGEVMQLLNQCYTPGKTVQQATFELVHALFAAYGLIVLIPDHGVLKKLMLPVFEDDLFQQTPSAIVEETGAALGRQYNIQAHPREVNLFYLDDGIRNRIIKQDEHFLVHDTSLRFTEGELKAMLQDNPGRFSPNVILRGLFQETILPNVAFIGGGGELAYWLQLKELFLHYSVPFPVLVLRNSFLIVDKATQQRIQRWQLSPDVLFQPELQIVNKLLAQEGKLPQLNGEVAQLSAVYEDLKKLAAGVDGTLAQHVAALQKSALKRVSVLEKKLMRAERRKHKALQHQIALLKEKLFPKNGLQERSENFSSFYAKWGRGFIDQLLQHSLTLEQQFTVLTEA
jgi:bacillithiol biosynthesis cysteine-adding enzyme BshC